MGSIGVFPSNYVTKLAPREKPLQCRAPVNINSVHGDGIIELLRDQVNNEKTFSVYFLLFPYPKNFSQFFSSHWKKIGIDEKVICYHNISN